GPVGHREEVRFQGGQLGDRTAQRLAAAWGARRVELERDPRPVAGLVVQRGGAHRRPRAQKNACITIDSIEPGGSTLPRGRLPLGGCCGVDEPGLSAALDGFSRWYRLSGYGPARLTSRDHERGMRHAACGHRPVRQAESLLET